MLSNLFHRRIFVALTLLALLNGAPRYLAADVSARAGKTPLLFLVDASGSMGNRLAGGSRLELSGMLINEQLANLDFNVKTGLVAFGNGSESCDSITLYNQVDIGNRFNISQNIHKLRAGGVTPLARTLQMIRTEIAPSHPGLKIVMVSDGSDSCGGDAAAEAGLLRELGVTINILAIDIEPNEERELTEVARRTGGRYLPVKNLQDFNRAMRIAIKERHSETEPLQAWNIDWQPRVKGANLQRRPATVDELLKNDFFIPSFERQPGLVITGVTRDISRQGKGVLNIDYYFENPVQGDYFVNLTIEPQSSDRSSSLYSAKNITIVGHGGAPHFGVFSTSGRVSLELNSNNYLTKPIFVKGELWRTSDVPERVEVANRFAVN